MITKEDFETLAKIIRKDTLAFQPDYILVGWIVNSLCHLARDTGVDLDEHRFVKLCEGKIK